MVHSVASGRPVEAEVSFSVRGNRWRRAPRHYPVRDGVQRPSASKITSSFVEGGEPVLEEEPPIVASVEIAIPVPATA